MRTDRDVILTQIVRLSVSHQPQKCSPPPIYEIILPLKSLSLREMNKMVSMYLSTLLEIWKKTVKCICIRGALLTLLIAVAINTASNRRQLSLFSLMVSRSGPSAPGVIIESNLAGQMTFCGRLLRMWGFERTLSSPISGHVRTASNSLLSSGPQR